MKSVIQISLACALIAWSAIAATGLLTILIFLSPVIIY